MGIEMAGKTKYLLRRDGRYFARIVIPADLRPYLENRTELRAPLGGDRREALRKHPIAVADLMHRVALAESRAAEAQGTPQVPGRYPMTDAQLAARSYQDRLEQDAKGRVIHPSYARLNIDDGYAAMLRVGMAGAASDAELHELVSHRIEYYRKIGNTTAELGTHEWRSLAISLCVSEYEALSRVAERDEGDFTGVPVHPMLRSDEPVADELPSIPLRAMFRDYLNHLTNMRRAASTVKKWDGIFENLREHLGHDDARRITRQDMMAWRDNLLQT